VALCDNDKDRKTTYVCGLFVVKTIQIQEIVKYVSTYQEIIPYSQVYEKFLKLKKMSEDDDEI
jgi:hypothetical protein